MSEIHITMPPVPEVPSERLRNGIGALHDSLQNWVGFDVPMSAITPEMVILMARQRVDDMDQQIASHMDALEQASNDSQQLTRQQEALNQILAAAQAAGTGDEKKFDPNGLMIEIQNADGTTREIAASVLLREVGHPPIRVNGEGKATVAQLETLINGVKIASRKINSSNEMRMMQIQTLTQQRTQVIQMSTNILQKLNEATSAIVGNLGR